MSLDVSTVGFKTQPYVFTYDWKTTVLYALGIGAQRDELDYLYEGRGPKVYPSFAVVPAYACLEDLVAKSGGDMNMVVHGGQSITLHEPLPAAATLHTVGSIRGIYDLKRLAQVVLATETTCDGKLLCETEWSIIVRNGGGFGGPRPPKVDIPARPKDRASDFSHDAQTLPEQALLYRLSGDANPLHADPAFAASVGFEAGPILHGLCTFGFLTRAVVQHACGGDATRLRHLHAQFRKPVWPGESIRTEGYRIDDGNYAFEAFAADREDPVVTNGWAKIRR